MRRYFGGELPNVDGIPFILRFDVILEESCQTVMDLLLFLDVTLFSRRSAERLWISFILRNDVILEEK